MLDPAATKLSHFIIGVCIPPYISYKFISYCTTDADGHVCVFSCRGLAPLNKPELQKVMEKRKRDQVLKAQKEELEAHKKRSDLEIELMKRQQKLEQVNSA